MTDLRRAAQAVIDEYDAGLSYDMDRAITVLRHALVQQDEPHSDYPCRADGRCQYAIDHGAEGMGHCPRGQCVMAKPAQEDA